MTRLCLAAWVGLTLAGCRVEPQPEPQTDAPLAPEARTPRDRAEHRSEPGVDEIELAEPELALGVEDLGVFSDLDDRVQISLPELDPAVVELVGVHDRARGLLLLYADGRPLKAYPVVTEPDGRALAGTSLRLRAGDHTELAPLLSVATLRTLAPGGSAPPGDLDDDGLPDPLDLDLGAIKTTLNADEYNQDYFSIPYPGGDVDRALGACTDVIVRALRNAGIDLQVEVHKDIARAPNRYPMVTKPNDDIDHRRVRTLLPWFRAHWIELEPDQPLAPGDVIFMDTITSRSGPDHIGIVGDRPGEAGRLLIANNWTDGYRTSFMDLLAFVEVSDRFRMPPAAAHAGPISAFATQLLVVVSPSWSSFRAELRRYERASVGAEWVALGSAIPVVLGRAGLGWGVGLHGEGQPRGLDGPDKREGDERSPAGVFGLGQAFGRGPTYATALAYSAESERLRCVDDPRSRYYAEIVDADQVSPDWASAEPMHELYELAIVVEHNLDRRPARGSCIFLHAWDGPDSPVTGCTAMASTDLEKIAAWLEPDAVIVTLPRSAYAELSSAWSLPAADRR